MAHVEIASRARLRVREAAQSGGVLGSLARDLRRRTHRGKRTRGGIALQLPAGLTIPLVGFLSRFVARRRRELRSGGLVKVMYLDEDVPLLEGCRRGNADCYQRLYEKYSGKVYGFARRFLRDDQHAEDVTQEVFLRVFRKLTTFRGDARFSTWLFRVTLNSCKNKRRSLDRDQRFDPERFQEERRGGVLRPEQALESRWLGSRIDAALDRLTEAQRALILLKAVDELSYREIGDLLGESENQVRGKLYRARKAFRDAIEAVGGRARVEEEVLTCS